MKKIRILIMTILICAFFSGCSIVDLIHYHKATALFNEEDYAAAQEAFSALGDYKDSADLVNECTYQLALEAVDSEDYSSALEYLQLIPNHKDATDLTNECNYQLAIVAIESEDHSTALEYLQFLADYKDAAQIISLCKYTLGVAAMEQGEWDSAITFFDSLDYEDSISLLEKCTKEKGMHENADYAFLEDILRSVNTRYELSDKDQDLSILVDAELAILQKYESENFYDSRLQELATAYIAGLNTQKASLDLKYSEHDIAWRTGFVERCGVLCDLHNEYQLFKNHDDYVAIYISDYETQKNELEAMKEIDADLTAQLDGITFQHNYQNKMTAPYTNNTSYNFDFNIYFTFYDYSGIRINESSRSFPDIKSGDVNTLSFWCPSSWYTCEFFWEIYDINTYEG